MKALLIGIGAICPAHGRHLDGPGQRHLPYPASSFMIDQSPWIAYGAVLALAGAALIWAARRR